MERLAQSVLPAVDGVRYLVSWQCGGDSAVPEPLSSRGDVHVVHCPGKGLSLNRNNALRHCTAPLVLVADDDVDYDVDGLSRAIEMMENEPSLGIATFMVHRPDEPEYPAVACELGRHMPKNYWVSSVEIMLRRAHVSGIAFDTRLGIGAEKMHCGEEELFVLTARRRGVPCKFFPIVIGTHADESSGVKASYGVLMGQGCIMALEYGRILCLPRLGLKAWRVWRAGRFPFFRALKALTHGALCSRHFSLD